MRYPIGQRLSSDFGFICAFSGHQGNRLVRTIEKTESGGWRCVRCVGLTDHNSVVANNGSPTAETLYLEITRPTARYEENLMLSRGCDYCKSPYKVTELDKNGYPLHPKHCNDCTKQCSNCGEWHLVTRFLPELMSNGYKDWIKTKARENDDSLGILNGRDSFIDECRDCKPFRDNTPAPEIDIEEEVEDPAPPKKEKIKQETSSDEILARLEAKLAGK